MQILGKANNTESVKSRHRKKLTLSKPFWLFAFTLTVGLMMTTGGAQAENASSTTLAANSELENSQRNVRDNSGDTLTPENQKANRSDRKITATIRQSIVKDKSLSFDAHNAKIITRDGVVTLRGPVENFAEKIKLQSIAEKKRGVKQVDNQLETKTP